MKVVILAGGLGTRINEETGNRPKPMIEIGGKPILWHIMKIYSHYGLNDFIICLGYKGYMIKEYFVNYYKHMSDLTINLKNSANSNVYIGVGGSTNSITSNYANNLYLQTERGIIFNAYGNVSNSTPSIVISGVSNVGIGTTDAGTNSLAIYGSCNYFSGSIGIGTTASGVSGSLNMSGSLSLVSTLNNIING